MVNRFKINIALIYLRLDKYELKFEEANLGRLEYKMNEFTHLSIL